MNEPTDFDNVDKQTLTWLVLSTMQPETWNHVPDSVPVSTMAAKQERHQQNLSYSIYKRRSLTLLNCLREI